MTDVLSVSTVLNPGEDDEDRRDTYSRRQMDRRLQDRIDKDHERLREISSRVGRMETLFNTIAKDMQRIEETICEMRHYTENTATSMAEVSNKLATHTEMEEIQWGVVNKSQETLALVTATLNNHLVDSREMTTRINWLEKLLLLLLGISATGVLTLIAEMLIRRFVGG